MFARILRWLFNAFYVLFATREIKGLERLPPYGPYIMVANHLSYFDVPLLYGVAGGPHASGWAAEKYERHPIFGPIVRHASGTFIQRGEVDRAAFAAATAWLEKGNVFGMSPEGTRSKTGALARGKTGAAYLAHLAGVPLVPVGLAGTEKVGRTLLRLRRPHVLLHFGKPFTLPPLPEEDRPVHLRQHTDEIMCRIAVLLPARYHGVYANHPRLKELLSESSPSNNT
jgi:1-acyl-sn-glycerol-3-phosphate acyltransferase